MKDQLNVLGIMNGTSIDGVDFVLCKIRRKPFSCTLVAHEHLEFSRELADDLRAAAQHKLHVDSLALLHHQLGRFYAESVLRVSKKEKWKIDLVGVHGQTVFHAPPHATLQIGESSYLQVALGVPVVSDFRALDLALGGQGAPIASLFHREVLVPLARKKYGASKSISARASGKTVKGSSRAPLSVAVQNLGGIANVSYFDGKHALAFDSGPANMLVDLAMKKFSNGAKGFDFGGEFAARGIAVPEVLNQWMKHEYLAQKPPKSCGREQFGEAFFAGAVKDLARFSNEDAVATLTEFTAASVAESYLKFLPHIPSVTVLCGGGAKKSFLRARLQFRLAESRVVTTDDLGWPVDAIEGAAFALLAAYRAWGLPSNIPATTGARRSASLGKIS